MSIIQPPKPSVITAASLEMILKGDWRSNRPPFSGLSLEDDVAKGDSRERAQAQSRNEPVDRVLKINGCPEILKWDLDMLCHKHRELSSISAVGRYVTRTGLRVINQMEVMALMRRARTAAYAQGKETFLGLFSAASEYQLHLGKGVNAKNPLYTRGFSWVHGALAQVANDLGIDLQDAVRLALVLGVAQSERWVPEESVERCLIAMQGWLAKMEEHVNRLVGMLGLQP